MNNDDFLAQAMRYQDGTLTSDDLAAFEVSMRGDPTKRHIFVETQLRSMALHNRFRQEAFRIEPATRRKTAWITRPITAMAAGLLIGLFSASLVWAISSPKTTTERLSSLINGNFDDSHLETGFPRQTAVWAGDEASITDGRLRFIATGSDLNDPSGRAIACDVFQLIDLRPLRHALGQKSESVLELSADFLDSRPANTKPSVSFFCQLYLFRGDPTQLHRDWPQSNSDALASGSAQITTLGSDGKGTRSLTARCLVPSSADFAVIQVAARPNLRPAQLDGLFADDVRLTLKTQPHLPIRIVQR
jgi:hypothetical protein